MTVWPRSLTALFLAAVLTAGVSCTSDDATGPSAPAGSSEMAGVSGEQSRPTHRRAETDAGAPEATR